MKKDLKRKIKEKRDGIDLKIRTEARHKGLILISTQKIAGKIINDQATNILVGTFGMGIEISMAYYTMIEDGVKKNLRPYYCGIIHFEGFGRNLLQHIKISGYFLFIQTKAGPLCLAGELT